MLLPHLPLPPRTERPRLSAAAGIAQQQQRAEYYLRLLCDCEGTIDYDCDYHTSGVLCSDDSTVVDESRGIAHPRLIEARIRSRLRGYIHHGK